MYRAWAEKDSFLVSPIAYSMKLKYFTASDLVIFK